MKIQVEADRFYKYMARFKKETGSDLAKTVKVAAELFARSAARHSPPMPGRRISRFSTKKDEKGNILQKRDMFNRTIRAAVYIQNGPHKIRLPEKRAKKYLNKSGTALSKSGKKSKLLIEYIVFAKKFGSRSFAKKIFKTLSEAKAAAKITTRGLLRAGWWGSVPRLGGRVDEVYGSKVASLISAVSKTRQEKDPDSVTISIINAVNIPGASEAASSAIAFGLGKAANQLRAMIRKAVEARAK